MTKLKLFMGIMLVSAMCIVASCQITSCEDVPSYVQQDDSQLVPVGE